MEKNEQIERAPYPSPSAMAPDTLSFSYPEVSAPVPKRMGSLRSEGLLR